MTTIAAALRDAAGVLTKTSKSPRLDAELLMAHALGVSRSDLLLKHLADKPPAIFMVLLERRSRSEPIAYILGVQEFYGREFTVTPDTLIPRPDSELLIDVALERSKNAKRVLDLGTGTGALILTFAAETGACGIGIDQSEAAIFVANLNARSLGCAQNVQMIQGDWKRAGWAEELGSFDLILCNPPYVESDADLDEDVRKYEPTTALFAGAEGLDDYRILIPQMRALLANGGIILLEIGHEQAEQVSAIASKSGFIAELFRDIAHRPRALLLR